MDLISHFDFPLQTQISLHEQLTCTNSSKFYRSNIDQKRKNILEDKIFTYILKRVQGRKLIVYINFTNNETINVKTMLIGNSMIKSESIQQTQKLFKYFLKQNNQDTKFTLKINPNNFQINIEINLVVSNLDNVVRNCFLDIIIQELRNLTFLLQKYYAAAIFIINSQQYQSEQNYPHILQNKKFASELKIFSKSSSHYTWNVLQGTSKCQRDRKSIYDEKKAQFRKIRSSIRQNSSIKRINKVYKCQQSGILPFFSLKVDEDQDLKQNYLTGTKLLNKNNQLIDEINLNKQELELLINNKQLNLELNSTDQNTKLCMHTQNIAQKINYQKIIVKQIPNYQFYGLPKYYIVKNTPITDYLLTNCFPQNNFELYVQKNSKTISFTTKLFIITQIVNTLKYLRDNSIVYHNLQPKNINIRKKLVVKLTNLSNAFNQKVSISEEYQIIPKHLKQNPVNIFPYVSNICNPFNRTIDQQRSDIFSLGSLIMELIFKKKIFDIKQSTVKKFSINQKLIRLSNNFIFNLQKINSIGNFQSKIFCNFIMQSLHHQMSLVESSQQQDVKNVAKISIKERPFLDWFIIISKHLLQNQQKY